MSDEQPIDTASILAESRAAIEKRKQAREAKAAAHARLNRLYAVAHPLLAYTDPSEQFHEHYATLVTEFVRVLDADGWWERAGAACAGAPDRQYTWAILCAAREHRREELVRLLVQGERAELIGYWLRNGLYRELIGVGQGPAPVEPDRAGPAEPEVGMTWQEAAERLERLRAQGEPWTSQHKMAKLFGCSSGTINKAIKETPELRAWAKRQTAAAPRAQSLNDVVTDRTAQSRELGPDDEVAIREYLEREDLTPEERAFFNSLSPEDRLDFLDDPDKHQKVLGRKP
jgi:hypothetical protein